MATPRWLSEPIVIDGGQTAALRANRLKLLGIPYSGWWFQISFIFTTIWGKISNLTNIFQMGWFNHQLGICYEKIKFKLLCHGPLAEEDGVFSTPMNGRK